MLIFIKLGMQRRNRVTFDLIFVCDFSELFLITLITLLITVIIM